MASSTVPGSSERRETTTRIDDFARQVAERYGVDTSSYEALWSWSVDSPAQFWRAVWDFYDLDAIAGPLAEGDDAVLASTEMPGAQWFPDVTLNYVDQVFRHADDPDAAARTAIVGVDESGTRVSLTWAQLRDQSLSFARTLRRLGVGVGDVVAAYLPDIPEALVAFLGTAAVGAIWSGCGQDYAPSGAAGRLAQLEPKVLVTADGYRYNGKDIDKTADSAELAGLLEGLSCHIVVGDPSRQPARGIEILSYENAIASNSQAQSDVPDADIPVRVGFDHPLWVLFSSGTTGRPKGIVHGHGGVVVEHLKAAGLHADLSRDDVFFWHTALSWMMWNFQAAGLLVGAEIVCYSGSPLYPDADRLWALVADERVTYFGTSPGQLQASRKAGLRPGRDHDLAALRGIGSTGSALSADLFDWIDENVRPGIPVSSISGGTDVVTAFAGGSSGQPVVPGELSVRYLGVELASWAPDTTPLIGEVGEMVVTAPMPSMPVSFWNDPDGARYRAAYFAHEWSGTETDSEPVWRHGDWVTVTDRGSLIIHGRSDATLNKQGVRMGSADIYEVVESLPEIAEAFVLGVDGPDGKYWMPLFVTLVPGATLDDDLRSTIASSIRTRLSPRHVPDEVIEAPGIPHTRTGKKLEVPVTAILAGRSGVDVDPRSIDDPGLIDWYSERGREHQW